jgi:hypothetical protein
MRATFKRRTRFFVAVEGESEQSFVAWLQRLAFQEDLAIHLDTMVLHGGGFASMLHQAVTEEKRRAGKRGPYKCRFLLVDEDRSHRGDWSVEKLKGEAKRHQMQVCVQRPNHEGLLYRMVNGHENDFVTATTAQAKLRACWRTYEKPVNAQKLDQRYSLGDLLRTANFDEDLCYLLRTIGMLR